MNGDNDQQNPEQKTPPMNWDQNSKFDPLALALHEYDVAIKARELHIAVWGYWYQRDEIVTAADRRAEELIRNDAKQIEAKVKSTLQNLILEARSLIQKERENGRLKGEQDDQH